MFTPATSSSTPFPDLLGKFSNAPHADIILRSSDSYEFRVQKFYVTDSSPVLGKQIMATLRHVAGPEYTTDGETKHEPLLPTFQLSGGHAIISSLLTFVFPVTPVLPPTIEQILELLSVAQNMGSLKRRVWRRKQHSSLNFPMTIEDFEDKFDIISGPALYELWKYRQQALLGLSVRLSRASPDCSFFSSKVYQILSGANLDCEGTSESPEIPLWLDEYLDSVAEDPSCLDLTTFHLALSSHVSSIDQSVDGCEDCKTISGETIRDFWSALTVTVHESIREAESEFSLTEGGMRIENSASATTKTPLLEGLNMQGADVILGSSDLVFFRVHKSTLAISSPFFNDMFSLPQPLDGEVIDGLPVVHVSEDSELLHSLLTVLYPIPSVIPDSYEKTLALLSVSQKYDMSTALSTFRSEIGRQLPTTEASFRAYAIASSKQLIPEMEIAARLTLDHSMTFEAIGDALRFFDVSSLHDLVHFCKRCRDNLLEFFEGFIDGSDVISTIWFDCMSSPPTSESDKAIFRLAKWLRGFIFHHIETLEETYTDPLPSRSYLHDRFMKDLLIHISDTNCPSCAAVYITNGEVFRDQLYYRVSIARDEEPFQLDAEASTSSGNSENANA